MENGDISLKKQKREEERERGKASHKGPEQWDHGTPTSVSCLGEKKSCDKALELTKHLGRKQRGRTFHNPV